MATYAYVAFEDSGRRQKGTVEAPDSEGATRAVEARGFHVLEVKESTRQANVRSGKEGVSRSDLALFTRRLADLTSAGVPIDRALRVSGSQSDSQLLRDISAEAVQEVHAGVPVSDALAKYPKQFPIVFTMTLKAGEASGQFPEVASRLAEFQQVEVKRRAQIAAALVYPCILAVSAVIVVAFMVLFVVPHLAAVFDKLGNDLPATTKLLLATTDFLSRNWLWNLIAVIALVVLFRAWTATDSGAVSRDRALMRMPLVGPVVAKAVVSRYARILGTLLHGGVPILDSLEIAGAASGNRVFERGSRQVQQEVREGRRLTDAMEESGEFSPILVQMVAVGEETGDLPRMLSRVSETLDFEVDNGMQKLTSLVEPLIVLGMGGFVGFVVLSILLPIYQAQDVVK